MKSRQSSTGETRIPFSIGRALRSLVLGKDDEQDVSDVDIEHRGAEMNRRVCCSGCLSCFRECEPLRIGHLNFFCVDREKEMKEQVEVRKEMIISGKTRAVKQDLSEDENVLPFSTPESIRNVVKTADSDTISIQSIGSFTSISVIEDENAFGCPDIEEDDEEFHDVEF